MGSPQLDIYRYLSRKQDENSFFEGHHTDTRVLGIGRILFCGYAQVCTLGVPQN